MDEKTILSICIPTYNRAEKLQQCLENIVRQFDNKEVKNAVEVVVSDNASTDTTAQMVEKFQGSFDNIKYFKNGKNIGMHDNIINSVVKATGKYCWHIGDDDFIQNGALKFLVDFLSKKDISVLTVNFYPFIDIDKSLRQANNIQQQHIGYYDSPEEFYKKGYCQGILGIFIVNRALWLKVDRTHYEPYWSYYEIMFKMLASSGLIFAHLDYPILFIGQDYKWNENGTALFTTIHVKRLFDKLRNFGYDKNFIDGEVNRFAKSIPSALLTAKAAGLKCSFANFWIVYKELRDYPIQLSVTAALFFIPNPIIIIIKKIKKHGQTK